MNVGHWRILGWSQDRHMVAEWQPFKFVQIGMKSFSKIISREFMQPELLLQIKFYCNAMLKVFSNKISNLRPVCVLKAHYSHYGIEQSLKFPSNTIENLKTVGDVYSNYCVLAEKYNRMHLQKRSTEYLRLHRFTVSDYRHCNVFYQILSICRKNSETIRKDFLKKSNGI